VSFPRPGDSAPAWSPDGRWIAFSRTTGRDSGIYVLRADGSDERRLTVALPLDLDTSPSWSPDSSTIAFASPHVSVPASEIELVGVDGGGRRVLPGSDLGTNPAWSPDGRAIAFVRVSGELATLPAGGGSARVLNREAVPLSRPVWSRDGREILFASAITFGRFRLHPLGSTGARLTPLPGLAGNSFLAWPDWSPDGGRIAYVDDYRLVVANADGRGRRVLTSGAAVQDPAWSPDGSWIAIRRAGDLFLITADGTRLHRITRTPHVEEESAWSPDGRWIVHVRRDRTRSVDRELWLVRPDGTGLRPLTDNVFEDTSPAWSPDGRRIAFVSGRTEGSFGPELWMMNADGSGERRVQAAVSSDGRERWSDERPSWSPDGRWILYESRADIWIVRPDGTGAIDLTPDPRSQDRDPAWQPRCTRSGNAGPNRLIGGRGADFLCGGWGSDLIVGGPGRDRLFGEQGDDVIDARDGTFDVVGCGAGRDTVTADRGDLVGVDCERILRS
jgi:Tol biopolymer transport system component